MPGRKAASLPSGAYRSPCAGRLLAGGRFGEAQVLAAEREARAEALAAEVVAVPERDRGAAVVLGLLRLPWLAAEIPCGEVHWS